jgi:NAD(P)-dependent dehydrogenase (short-subunit alcohol dehydrogenase family)
MSLPTSITGHTDPTHPSQHLTGFSKLRWALKNPPIDPNVTFAHKTILVTGANTGLGFEAALKYAQKGCAKLILAVRSMEKGQETKTRILSRSNRIEDEDFVVKVMTVDLASFPSILTFASLLETELGEDGLHVSLLNAGLYQRQLTCFLQQPRLV